MVTAGFKDVVEADDVTLDIGIRVLDAVAHARLGSEIHYNVEMVLLKEAVNEGFVGKVTFYEGPTRARTLSLSKGRFIKGRLFSLSKRRFIYCRPFDKLRDLSCLFYLRKPVFFQPYIVIVVHAVKTDDIEVFFGLQQP